MTTGPHKPVLLNEVLEWLQPQRGGYFVDCTVGLGGHAEALLTASGDVTVIGIDRDSESLGQATTRLASFGARFRPVHGNFKELDSVLNNLGINSVRGVLADLGISSYQLESPERGFSFSHEGPLDMRMDRTGQITAAQLVARLPETELADIIFKYGEERASRRIARAIVRERQVRPIQTTKHLAEIVAKAARVRGRWRIHPATRTFQALRIAVNEELMGLDRFVSTAISNLEPAGRLAVISFHSLEDRIIKQRFRIESGLCMCEDKRARESHKQSSDDFICSRCGARKRVEIMTRRPIKPRAEEIEENPRSRSARLRVCERIAHLPR